MLWHIAGARVKGESPPRQPSDTAWESYPRAVPPTRVVRQSPTLCGSCAGKLVSTPRHCVAHSRTASTSHPSKEDGGTLEKGTIICPAPAQDGAVMSDQWSMSPPSLLALCGHPHHYAAIPGTAASSPALWKPGTMGHRHTRRCASSDPPSAQPSSRCTGGDRTRSSHTTTLEAAPGQSQDLPRRQPELRFFRTTINSTTLCAMLPYVALEPCSMTVNHLPLAYKRWRRSLGRRGRTDNCTLAHFHQHPRYLHFTSIKPQGPGGLPSSPALLVAPLCKHHSATQYNAPSAPLLDVQPTARTRINSCHCVA
jgi:hypothetical protein